jgi:hypothetical protein
MSVEISENRIDYDVKPPENWTDLNKDGKRMDRVIRACMTQFTKKENPHELKMVYLDRLLKATATKQKLAETVLGVKELLKQ